jgi:hypothetical protein
MCISIWILDGGHVRARPRDGDGGPRGARHAEECPRSSRPPDREVFTSTCRSCAGRPRKTSWRIAKALAFELGTMKTRRSSTTEYRRDKRLAGACWSTTTRKRWGTTLASVYSVRPLPEATFSTRHLEGSRARHPHRGFHGQERARAGREARRPLETASRLERPLRSVDVRLKSRPAKGRVTFRMSRGVRSATLPGRDHSPSNSLTGLKSST